VVSKFELPETQFKRTVRNEISCKTHLEWENDCFKHFFGILIKFSIPCAKKTIQNLVQSGKEAVSKFDLPEGRYPVKLTKSEKITVLSTFLEYSLNLLSNT